MKGLLLILTPDLSRLWAAAQLRVSKKGGPNQRRFYFFFRFLRCSSTWLREDNVRCAAGRWGRDHLKELSWLYGADCDSVNR